LEEGSGNDKDPAFVINIVQIPVDIKPFDVGVDLPDPKSEGTICVLYMHLL